MYSLIVAFGLMVVMLFAVLPLLAICCHIPSRVWGVILTGVLLSYWFPGAPGALIVLITAAFGLTLWIKSRQHHRHGF